MGSEIYCGRWEDLMPKQPDESVDLILTDPPYGLGQSCSNIPGDKRWNLTGESESRFNEALTGDVPEENAAIDWKTFFQLCYNVLKPDSYCVLHCPVPFIGQKWEVITQSGFRYKGTIAWSKKFAIGGDLRGAAKRDWEPILYLAKGRPVLNPLKVLRKGKVQERKRISEIEDWEFVLPGSERLGHPTQKPVALEERFIEWMTQRGDVVLDPFAGSGTTLVASKLQGRRGIGFELKEEFCQLARERLATVSENGSLSDC